MYSQAEFPINGLLTVKESAHSVHVEFPCRHCKRQTFGTLPSSTTPNWGSLPRLLIKRLSRVVERCGSAKRDSYMVHAWRCYITLSLCSSGVLEQSVYVTMDRTRWTNSTACSLPGLKSLRFLSLLTSEAYCLYYRRQWRTGLTTTNSEWIWDGSCNIWNVPTSQEIAVQKCNVLCWSSRYTLLALPLTFRKS